MTAKQVRSYDLTEGLSRDPRENQDLKPTTQKLATALSRKLSGELRAQVKVEASLIESARIHDWLTRLPSPSPLGKFHLPDHSLGLLHLDPKMARRIIQVSLGAQDLDRFDDAQEETFSKIDLRVLKTFMEEILFCFTRTCALSEDIPIGEIEDRPDHLSNLIGLEDIVTLRFEVEFKSTLGFFTIAVRRSFFSPARTNQILRLG